MAFNVSATSWESDVNVNSNTSVAHVKVTITTTEPSYSNYDHYGTIVIDGTSYSHGAYTLPHTTTRTFESTKTITHNDDGSKSINWSYSFPVKKTDTRTGSGSLTLTTIARASQPSVSSASVNLGSSVTINTNRASNSFTHTITYSIGSLTNQTSGLSANTNVGASCTFTPPASLANQFPNSKNGTVTITCKTYNGSTLLGTKTCTLTVSTIDNSTYKPTINFGTNNNKITPIKQFGGKYLNKVSGVTISSNRSAKYGASVSSYTITAGGKSSSNNDLSINPINITMSSASQDVTINGIIIDSRGYQGTGSTSIKIYRYNVPQITEYSIARCTSNGTLATNGTYAKVSLKYTYQNDGYSNNMSVHKININGADTTITTTETTSSGVVTGTGTQVVGGGNLAVNNHYSYTITCTDAVGKTTSVNGILQTSSRIINVRPGGKGIAFGKFAEDDNLVDSEWDIKAPNFQGTATNATNATNLNIAQTNPTSGTNYYIPFSTEQSGNQRERANDGLKYYCLNGTASAVGTGELCLGNGTSTGTAGNKRGHLRLMSEKSGSVYLRATAGSTASRWVTFPDLGGTAVVKQSDAIAKETNGWYKVNMGAFTIYFKQGSTGNVTHSANGGDWYTDNTNHWRDLPSGITFNNAKMAFVGTMRCEDAAIDENVIVDNGATQVSATWRNKYGKAITKTSRFNFLLIVFP